MREGEGEREGEVEVAWCYIHSVGVGYRLEYIVRLSVKVRYRKEEDKGTISWG